MPYVWPLAGFGVLWIIDRILYAADDDKDPAKRTPGFVMAMFAANELLLGGVSGILMKMIR